jgi:hypothetical protein
MFRGSVIVRGCDRENDLERLHANPLRQQPLPASLLAWRCSRSTWDQRTVRCHIPIVSTRLFPLHDDRLSRLLALFAAPKVGPTCRQPRSSEVAKCIDQQSCEHFSSGRAMVDQPQPSCKIAFAAAGGSHQDEFLFHESLDVLDHFEFGGRTQGLEWRVSYDRDAVIGEFHEATQSRTSSRQSPATMALRGMEPEATIHSLEFVRLFVGNMMSRLHHSVHRGHFRHTVRGILVFQLTRAWTPNHRFATGGIMTRRPKMFSHPTVKTSTVSVSGGAHVLHDLTQTLLGLRRVRHTGAAMLETSFADVH